MFLNFTCGAVDPQHADVQLAHLLEVYLDYLEIIIRAMFYRNRYRILAQQFQRDLKRTRVENEKSVPQKSVE